MYGNMGKIDFNKGVLKCNISLTIFCEMNIAILVNTIKYLLSFKSRIKSILLLTGIS